MNRNSKRTLTMLLSIVFIVSVVMAVSLVSVNAAPAWAPNTYYAIGTVVTYNGTDYQCIQAHTSLVGWEPPNVPALWTPVGAASSPTPSVVVTPTATNTPTQSSGVTPTATNTPTATPTTSSVSGNLAQGKAATASSVEPGTSFTANLAVDGNTSTRWSSDYVDSSWIYVDLGQNYNVNQVKLNWEAAYGKSYKIQVSTNATAWTDVYSTTNSDGGIDDISFPTTSARYVKMQGVTRATQWGYSLWEFEVYSGTGVLPTPTNTPTTSSVVTPTATNTPTNTPTSSSGGKNMKIMTWVPGYNQSAWMSALNANTGGSYNPRNTLTHIGAQFWQVQSNGTNVQLVSNSDVQWVKNYCQTNGIKFLICTFNYINGWNWQVAASAFANNKTTLINNLISLVNQWGADGVDIDYEGNEAGDPYRSEFATFIRELGTQLHSMGKELTVDTFPYIWNQPNTNWWPDWVGYVDAVNSMGYNELFGGGANWQAYRWQQDTALNAGYKTYQFQMGMPGWLSDWGSGGLGTSVLAHVNELLSGNYNRYPTSICIWDAQFNGSGWLSAQVWDGLHQMRMKTGN